MSQIRCFFAFFACIVCHEVVALGTDSKEARRLLQQSGFVSVELQGQFGNQLFQIAAAHAYSLDQHIPLTIPNLFRISKWNIGANAQRLFAGRIMDTALPNDFVLWEESSLRYTPIPRYSNIRLFGYFQSEKYFKHRREEILELFAPPGDLEEKIRLKYPFLSSDTLFVGVQIRDYRHEFPLGDFHPTHGRAYYEKAVRYFPVGTTFVVSTNHIEFAKECMEGLSANIIYLQSQDYIEDFYALTFCKSFIISNSSFGWWAAWLSKCDDKVVIAPSPWLSPPHNDQEESKDLVPKEWLTINN